MHFLAKSFFHFFLKSKKKKKKKRKKNEKPLTRLIDHRLLQHSAVLIGFKAINHSANGKVVLVQFESCLASLLLSVQHELWNHAFQCIVLPKLGFLWFLALLGGGG